jgi:hypothetical protein
MSFVNRRKSSPCPSIWMDLVLGRTL